MKFEWSGKAYCDKCGLSFSDVEPELIIQTELGREHIFCPCCLELIHVTNTGDVMGKKPIKIMGYHIDSMKVIEEISQSEEGKKRIAYITQVIRVMRAKMRLDPINFHSE